jgi:hypothetical protein
MKTILYPANSTVAAIKNTSVGMRRQFGNILVQTKGLPTFGHLSGRDLLGRSQSGAYQGMTKRKGNDDE